MDTFRTAQFLVGSALLGLTVACSRPTTDIVSTVTEDVGPWDMVNAREDGQTLTADVCVARADSADEVSERLLMQLFSKSYEQVDLTMYAGDGQDAVVRKVTWTSDSGRRMQQVSAGSQSPCNARQARQQEQQEGGGSNAPH